MKEKIYILKKLLLELEESYNNGPKHKLSRNIDGIIDICNELKSELNKENKSTIKVANYCIINTLPFIFKPTIKNDYFEGDYLVNFAQDRTRELKRANAIDQHNKFWMEHKPLKGNIFGSVPKELLTEKSAMSLFNNGWKEAVVDIIEISENNIGTRDVMEFCEENFKNYVLIKEEQTKSHLVLNYKIKDQNQ